MKLMTALATPLILTKDEFGSSVRIAFFAGILAYVPFCYFLTRMVTHDIHLSLFDGPGISLVTQLVIIMYLYGVPFLVSASVIGYVAFAFASAYIFTQRM